MIEPFERWALDLVRLFNPPSNQKSYILVATDYITKWVEIVALPRGTEETGINFLFEIFVRYGLPKEVIIDGGPQFVGHKIAATLRNHHITHKTPWKPLVLQYSKRIISKVGRSVARSRIREFLLQLLLGALTD